MKNYNDVNWIRKRISKFRLNRNYLLDEIDIYLICSDDWSIERFLLDQKDQQSAFSALLKAMQWKNEFGVHKRTDKYFMREFFEWGDPELYGRDKQGRYIVWANMRNTNQPNNKDIIEIMKMISVHFTNKHDKIAHKNGLTFVNCFFGFDTKNINIDFIKFLKKSGEVYPLLERCYLIIGLKTIHFTIAKWVLPFFKKSLHGLQRDIKFISIEELNNFMDSELIPVEIGGSRLSEIIVQDNLKTLKELKHFNLKDQSIKIFYNYHNSLMEKINLTKQNARYRLS